MQLGFTHRFDISPYDTGCTLGAMSLPDMVTVDPTFTGDQRTRATEVQVDTQVIIDWTNSNWPTSSAGAWLITLAAQDRVGDNSKLSGIGAYTGGANPCP